MIGFKIPVTGATILEIGLFIYLRHNGTQGVPVPVNTDPAHTAQNKIHIQGPGHPRAIGKIRIVLVVVFAGPTGNFRRIGCCPAGDAVADKFY